MAAAKPGQKYERKGGYAATAEEAKQANGTEKFDADGRRWVLWRGRWYTDLGETPERYKNYGQEELPPSPGRELAARGRELKELVEHGQLDWGDLHDRYVEIWMEGRMVVERAKRSKSVQKVIEPGTGKMVESYGPNDKLVLEALMVLRNVVDSMAKIRREAGDEKDRAIPRWAVARIEFALRKHPDAMKDLLTELAAGPEKDPQKVN